MFRVYHDQCGTYLCGATIRKVIKQYMNNKVYNWGFHAQGGTDTGIYKFTNVHEQDEL